MRFLQNDLKIKPLARAETIPSDWYTDPAMNAFERKTIFDKTWQFVCHISKLSNPGDHAVASVADNPVLVVRGSDGSLRAFYNVCRHRGGPIAVEDGCGVKALQCKYHGWTYTLDGHLRGVPKFDRTELFNKKNYGLVPVNLDIWDGLIFVNLDEKPAPLAKFYHGISERIHPLKLGPMRFHQRVIYDVQCNWKVYVDNYLEGYHLPFVHPELCKLLDYAQYQTETFECYSLQHSPITPEENIYTSGAGTAFYYFVFPNFMLNILPGRLQTNLVLPLSHDRCRVIFDYHYNDTESEIARKKIDDDLKYSDWVQHEDITICEHVQKGLNSKAYTKGRFSVEMENAVHHFQSLLKTYYKKSQSRSSKRKISK